MGENVQYGFVCGNSVHESFTYYMAFHMAFLKCVFFQEL